MLPWPVALKASGLKIYFRFAAVMSCNAHPSSIAYYPRPDSYEYLHQSCQPAGYNSPFNIFSHSNGQHYTANPSIHTHHFHGVNASGREQYPQVYPYTNSSEYQVYHRMPLHYSPVPSNAYAGHGISQYNSSSARLTQMYQPYSQHPIPVSHHTITGHPTCFDVPQLGSHIPSSVYSSTNNHYGVNVCRTASNNPCIKHSHYNRPTLRSTGASVSNKTQVNGTEDMKEEELSSVKEGKESNLCEFDFSSSVSDKVLWEEIYGELPEIVKLSPLFPELEQGRTMK